MKRVLSIVLSVAMVLCLLPAVAFPAAAAGNTTEFAGGSGTAEDPYLISTAEHLDNVRYYLDAHFKIISDIELTNYYTSDSGWLPIGSTEGIYYTPAAFTGCFDGNFKKIVGLKIEVALNEYANYQQLGFFALIQGGQVKNVLFEGGNISLVRKYSGASPKVDCGTLAGTVSDATIKNVYCCLDSIEFESNGHHRVGGIIGNAENSVIENCVNTSPITAPSIARADIGGVLGAMNGKTTVAYCFNGGTLNNTNSNTRSTGGIVGDDDSAKGSYIHDCYNAGNINAGYHSGGILGSTYGAVIENCYNAGKMEGRATISIVSGHNQTITNCYYQSLNGSEQTGAIPLTEKGMEKASQYVGFDFDSVWTMGGDPKYPYPELQCFALSGKLGIDGDVAYLSTVEVDLSNIKCVDDTFAYEWFVDGQSVGTEKTYTLKSTDIGKRLQCKVVGTKRFNMGTLYSEEVLISKAKQSDLPKIPELLSINDHTFEINTVSTQEYSIDNVNWQSNGVFENLDPNKEYTVYSRILENDLYLLGDSHAVMTVSTDRRPLSGVVNIVGTARFGDTLTADVSGVGPTGATYRYEWKRGDTLVGTASTYTITKEDIGNAISVSVIGTDNFIGTLTSAAVTATKASVQLPSAPVVAKKTNTCVWLTEKSGYEYSLDKVTWQDSPIFDNLSVATEYTFYQRVKETDTTFASKASNGTKAVTLKNSISAPAAPTVANITNISVTLTAIENYEYSMDGVHWQSSPTFSGLDPNVEYTFCQRIAENATDYASAQSGYTMATTLKNAVKAPNAPTLQKATDSSVTLTPVTGYEYSLDGDHWQKSNVFSGLETLKTYTFYQRVAETETDYASPSSQVMNFKVKYVASKPNAPTLKEKSNDRIEVVALDGYQYSLDGQQWRNDGLFTGLQPNTVYTVYCRTAETDANYVSVSSKALTVTTLKNTVNAPSEPPKLVEKTASSVRLAAVDEYEYSKDGISWQTSAVFEGLSPNTAYTFYQRVAETDTSYASEKSSLLAVTTAKNTVAAPTAPIVSSKTATSVTLAPNAAYEFSKDGVTWQKSNHFDNLTVVTVYTFYQRVAETNTDYPSAASAGTSVTTSKYTSHTPPAPEMVEVTQTTVTLLQMSSYEYSLDGTNWQSSSTFTGLTSGTSYTFYQRVAETETRSAGETSPVLRITTLAKSACPNTPVKPVVVDSASYFVELRAVDGYEYKCGNGTWQDSPYFSGLSRETAYTFYQRIKATATTNASATSAGLAYTTPTAGLSTVACYNLLWSHIGENGTYTGGYRQIELTKDSRYIHMVQQANSIFFFLESYSQSSGTIMKTTTSFELKPYETEILTYCTIGMYYSNGNLMAQQEDYAVIDRTTYSSSTVLNMSTWQYGSSLSNLYHNSLHLLCLYISEYCYDNLDFPITALGFSKLEEDYDFDNYKYCDPAAGYHRGKQVLRYQYAATCESDGYTGDTCCDECNGVIRSGSVISARGEHTYSNACDTSCSECGWIRDIAHSYSGDCDTTCNVCNTQRTPNHLYDDCCDANCNECGEERKAPHVYDDSKDLTCNNCGFERPPYTPGDIDGVEGINDRDAVYMLMNSFFPDDYPLNQSGDFDGDGKVNDRDAIYLLMYSFFPDDYPLMND